MRRINHKFDDDDLYGYGDADYDEDYFDEEEEAAARIAAQYAAPSRDAQSTPPPAPVSQQQQPPRSGSAKSKSKKSAAAKTPSLSKDEQRALAAKVFQVQNVVPDASQDAIREALRACDGDADMAALQLLEKTEQAAVEAVSAVADDVGAKVVSLGPQVQQLELKPSPAAEASASPAAGRADSAAVAAKDENDNDNDDDDDDAEAGKPSPRYANFASKLPKLRGIAQDKDSSSAPESGAAPDKPNLNLVVVGHVDAGKSTLMGHLLLLLDVVSQRQMHKFHKESRELNKASFAFAWIMDEHEDERARGVTVEVGVRHFDTPRRRVTLLDAPGHRDFIPSMISGAAQGDVAVLVVPASPGEFERSFERNGQTKEHALLVRYCGIRRLVVAVNKMDACEWSQQRFDAVEASLRAFLQAGGYAPKDLVFVPVSGLQGLNLTTRPPEGTADWYQGPTLLACLDELPPARRPAHKPLRLVVADVNKTMALGALTASGKIEAGVLREGDFVYVSPAGERAKVKGILRHRGGEPVPARYALAGENVDVGLTGIEDTMIGAASVLCEPGLPIPVVSRFVAEVATFDGMAVPLLNGSQVQVHLQSAEVPGTIGRLLQVTEASGAVRRNPRFVRKNQTAQVEVRTAMPVCVERYDDFRPLSRVLLRQNGATVAAGRVLEL